MFKRFFDLALCSVFLPFFLLAGTSILLALLVTQGRPIFFVQERVGRDEDIFKIYKFRTMLVIDDNKNINDSNRLTAIGKFLRSTSLDEIPQVLNILKGNMSFVGPRPLLPEYLSLYSKKQRKRHCILPGVTGWAQVNGRNSLTWEEKFELDIWYVENRTLLLDVKILLVTIKKVLFRENISLNNHVTMKRFKGNKID